MFNYPAHYAALIESQRLPTLAARLAALACDPAESPRSTLRFYEGTFDPDNPEPPTTALVSMPLTARAGVIVDALIPDPEADPEDPEPPQVRELKIVLDVPLEGTLTAADPVAGSVPGYAVLFDPAGMPINQFSVSLTGDGGEIELVQTGEELGAPVVRWYNGALARVSAFVIAG